MRYVLVIPGWFPSKVNFLAGDFIERHAKAASLFFPLKVLFVVKDNTMPMGSVRLERNRLSDRYESFVYYYSARTRVGALEKLLSAWLQSRCLSMGYKTIVRSAGTPSLVHAHVLVKHAWFALKISKKKNIPLLASEQWTGYLPEAKGEMESLTAYQKRTFRKVFEHAVHVTTVSDYLAKSIRASFGIKEYSVIPNLVDTSVFQPSNHPHDGVTRFIHISTLSAQKNFDEILEACRQLKDLSPDFLLTVVAPHNDYGEQVASLGLSRHVIFHTEVPQQLLSRLVAGSDALILYSLYETFGCVVAEANACGVPVIASDHPVFDENVLEGITGFKVRLHDPSLLADRMLKIINKQHGFRKEQIISITKEKYSVEVIGKQFAAAYDRYAKR